MKPLNHFKIFVTLLCLFISPFVWAHDSENHTTEIDEDTLLNCAEELSVEIVRSNSTNEIISHSSVLRGNTLYLLANPSYYVDHSKITHSNHLDVFLAHTSYKWYCIDCQIQQQTDGDLIISYKKNGYEVLTNEPNITLHTIYQSQKKLAYNSKLKQTFKVYAQVDLACAEVPDLSAKTSREFTLGPKNTVIEQDNTTPAEDGTEPTEQPDDETSDTTETTPLPSEEETPSDDSENVPTTEKTETTPENTSDCTTTLAKIKIYYHSGHDQTEHDPSGETTTNTTTDCVTQTETDSTETVSDDTNTTDPNVSESNDPDFNVEIPTISAGENNDVLSCSLNVHATNNHSQNKIFFGGVLVLALVVALGRLKRNHSKLKIS